MKFRDKNISRFADITWAAACPILQ